MFRLEWLEQIFWINDPKEYFDQIDITTSSLKDDLEI